MPVLPPLAAQPYDSLNVILDTARERLNDEIKSVYPTGGKLLDNTQDYSLVVVNAAWWRLQEKLADLGDTQFKDEVIISNLPALPTGSLDPASQVWLDWFGYFDTQNYFQQPAIPMDVTHPLKIWERWSNQNMPFGDPMECMLDGIPNVAKWSANRFWEWRNNKIYMPGAQQVVDIKIRYATFKPDFGDVGANPWFMQLVPVRRCRDAFSWYICAELASSREEPAISQKAAVFEARADAAADKMFNRDVVRKQRVNVRRQPRSGRTHGSWDWQ